MTTGQMAPDGQPAPLGAATDRPWQVHATASVDHTVLRRWRREADRRHAEFRQDLTGARAPELAPGISVIVPSYPGHGHLERCLRSLAAQSLDRSRYEVIVVPNGPAEGARDIVDECRKADPELDLRTVELGRAGASRARNAGLASARRRYTTFVDDDDYVSAGFLDVLLAHAGPLVVPVVPVVDVDAAGENADNYINRALAPHLGRLMPASQVPRATSFNAAKAVATEVAREIGYDCDLASGEDVVFWTTVAVRAGIEFLPCPPESGAVYYRSVRGGSVSRQESSFEVEVDRRLEILTRLDRLMPQADASGSALVRDKMAQVTNFVNAHVRKSPASHREVVAGLDSRPIAHLPYEHLNRSLARGLVIAYAFPPYADTSGVVTAKRLRARAEVADVVCNAMDRIRRTDHSARRIAGPYVERQEYVQTPSAFEAWSAMEAFVVEGLAKIRARQGGRERYEWLYSRAQFAASHLLAAVYKLANPETRWVAEFSDPLSRNVLGEERGKPVEPGAFHDLLSEQMGRRDLPLPDSPNSMVWAEELAYVLADEVIFTNEHQRDYMLSYCSRADAAEAAQSKAVISPHPTLPRPFYSMVDARYPLEDDLIHIGYFGTFYANRGAGELLSALAAVDLRTRARVRLHVFATNPDDVAREAAERGLGEHVRAETYLSYLEFLNLTTKLDVLVVADAGTEGRHERNPFLPSKWSDYRSSGTPVWGMVEDGSPLSDQPLDFMSPLGDPGAGADLISDLVRRGPPLRGNLAEAAPG